MIRKPSKPRKPTPPLKILTTSRKIINLTNMDTLSIKYVLEEITKMGYDVSDCYFNLEVGGGCYDDYMDVNECGVFVDKNTPNPTYDTEKKQYDVKLEKYNKKMKEYPAKLEEYYRQAKLESIKIKKQRLADLKKELKKLGEL